MTRYARLTYPTAYGIIMLMLAITRVAGGDAFNGLDKTSRLDSLSGESGSARFSLTGVIFVQAKPIAAIFDKETHRSQWVEINEGVSGYIVKEITLTKAILAHPESGRELVVFFSPGAVEETGISTGSAPYTKAWINSNRNPMVRRMQPLPIDVYRKWGSLTIAEKTEIIDFYKKHGWRLISADTIAGATTFAWENIYEADRDAVIKANRTTFTNSLSDEQRLAWQQVSSNPPIRITDGKPTPEQLEIGNQRKHAFEEYKASLSAAQRKQFEEIPDFTKADWR